MIVRIWHGYTTFENADKYEQLLKAEVFTGIKAKNMSGYHGIQLVKRKLDTEVEFITIMTFTDYDCVKQLVGEDYQQAYVPVAARKILSHFDERSQHYEVIHTLNYDEGIK